MNVIGVSDERSLKDKSLIVRRKIKSLEDEGVADFSKPLMALEADLIP